MPTAGRASWSRVILWGVAIAVLLALGKLVDAPAIFRSALEWIQGLGPWGPAIFMALYVAATVLLLPAFVLTLGAGAVYGVILGSVLVSIGATVGATAAFFIGRYLAREWVARKIEGNPAFKALDEAVGREGWKIVGLTRLSPALPFVLQNYAYGLTRVVARDYILASWIGMTPGILMYAYLGSLAGGLATLGASGSARTPAEWALYILGLAATVAVTVYVTRLARAALQQRIAG
ncbi:MAG: TVP38/TMEM64 family protein [candidate division NC10 bacterium]|nr:TVP38/TMEM64 family protein [candidate division NC10 bacterium]